MVVTPVVVVVIATSGGDVCAPPVGVIDGAAANQEMANGLRLVMRF